jgi:hypothetical protein
MGRAEQRKADENGDELEQVDILVILVHALKLRRILQLIVSAKDALPLPIHPRFRLAKQLDELWLSKNLAKRFWVGEDGGADELELVGTGSPATTAEHGLAGLQRRKRRRGQ